VLNRKPRRFQLHENLGNRRGAVDMKGYNEISWCLLLSNGRFVKVFLWRKLNWELTFIHWNIKRLIFQGKNLIIYWGCLPNNLEPIHNLNSVWPHLSKQLLKILSGTLICFRPHKEKRRIPSFSFPNWVKGLVKLETDLSKTAYSHEKKV